MARSLLTHPPVRQALVIGLGAFSLDLVNGTKTGETTSNEVVVTWTAASQQPDGWAGERQTTPG